MIELAMVRRIVVRGLVLTPVVALVLLALTGVDGALAGAIGLVLTVLNLWIGGRILGGLAENRPDLLLVGAMAALVVAFALTGGALLALEQVDFIDFRVAAITLVASHLVLVTWEAADRLLRLPPAEPKEPNSNAARTRS